MAQKTIDERAELVKTSFDQIKTELAKVIVGQIELINHISVCLLLALV